MATEQSTAEREQQPAGPGWHAIAVDEVAERLTTGSHGRAQGKVRRRLEQHGANGLASDTGPSELAIIARLPVAAVNEAHTRLRRGAGGGG